MKQFLADQNGQLQTQILQLPSNNNNILKDNLRQEKLGTYLGIVRGLSDPFNLFVNITDIEEDRILIYFFSYSMGSKKVAVWVQRFNANLDIDRITSYLYSREHMIDQLIK